MDTDTGNVVPLGEGWKLHVGHWTSIARNGIVRRCFCYRGSRDMGTSFLNSVSDDG